MTDWLGARSLLVRVLVYGFAAALLFALAAGAGAIVALTLQGDAGPPEGQSPPGGLQEERPQQKEAASTQDRSAADRSADAAQRAEVEYVDAVGDIQAAAVVAFRNSHEKLLRYDALSAADVEEMEANETALRNMAGRAADLVPPEKYEEQHEVFGAAIDGLRGAVGLAHAMAADPVAVTGTAFDEYDGRVDEATALLRRSNELLGEDYETIGDAREVSPEF